MKKNLLFTVIGVFLTVGAMSQTNLLKNGDFEEQGAWEIVTKGALTEDDATIVFTNPNMCPKYGDENSLLVSWEDFGAFWELWIYQKVTLEVGKKYEFTGAFRDIVNKDMAHYWIQVVMMPVNDWDMTDVPGPDWSTFGVNTSVLLGMGEWNSFTNEGGKGQDTTFTFHSQEYEGAFTGEIKSNCNQGDTTIFTVPTSYPTTAGGMNLGAEGDKVEFYFMLYFGQGSERESNEFGFTFDEFSIHEYSATDAVIIPDNSLDNITLYPNPVEEMLTVKSDNGLQSVSILNIVGKEVLKLNDIYQNTATINTSGLNKGIYLVRVLDDNGRMLSKKIVKQ